MSIVRGIKRIDWSQTPVNIVTKARKGRNKDTIVNPIFAQCADLTTDPYWVSIFAQASHGKMPKKFMVKEGTKLIFKRGTKIETMIIPTSASEAYEECTSFFRYHAGLLSELDQAQIESERQTKVLKDVNLWESWGGLRDVAKNYLINNYIVKLKSLHCLNKYEEAQLRETINIGLITKKFNKCNITLDGPMIDQIVGLFFDFTTRKYSIDPNIKAKNVTKSKPTTKKSFAPGTQKPLDDKWLELVELYWQKLGKIIRGNPRPPTIVLNIVG